MSVTIRVSEDTREELRKLKEHPRETDGDVVDRILQERRKEIKHYKEVNNG